MKRVNELDADESRGQNVLKKRYEGVSLSLYSRIKACDWLQHDNGMFKILPSEGEINSSLSRCFRSVGPTPRKLLCWCLGHPRVNGF